MNDLTFSGGQDFVPYQQTVTFLSDVREQTIELLYIDDDVVENTESFVFYISVPVGEVGYTEGQNNVEMNIRDTDCKSDNSYFNNNKFFVDLTISLGSDTYTIMENETELTVTLYVTAGRTEVNTRIYIETEDGTASAGKLYSFD